MAINPNLGIQAIYNTQQKIMNDRSASQELAQRQAMQQQAAVLDRMQQQQTMQEARKYQEAQAQQLRQQALADLQNKRAWDMQKLKQEQEYKMEQASAKRTKDLNTPEYKMKRKVAAQDFVANNPMIPKTQKKAYLQQIFSQIDAGEELSGNYDIQQPVPIPQPTPQPIQRTSNLEAQAMGVSPQENALRTIIGIQRGMQEPALRAMSRQPSVLGPEAVIGTQTPTTETQPSARVEAVIGRPMAKTYERDIFGDIQEKDIGNLSYVASEKELANIAKASGKQIEDVTKSYRNLIRMDTAIQGLVARGKQAYKELGGLGTAQVLGGKARQLYARTGLSKTGLGKKLNLPELTPEQKATGLSAYEGQLQEVILAAGPVLTNQNRVMRGVLSMLKKTFPKIGVAGTTEEEFTSLLKQSMENAYKLSLGLSKGVLSKGEISDLESGADQEKIEKVFKDVYQRAGYTDADKALFEKQWKRLKDTPASTPDSMFGNQVKEPTGGGSLKEFATEKEALAAGLPEGTRVRIGGKLAEL